MLGILAELAWRTGLCLVTMPLRLASSDPQQDAIAEKLGRPQSGGPLTISVIIPCYNEESRVTDAVCSALSDDFVTEVIVSDGGSSDQSLARVLALMQDRVRILQGGSSRASCQNAAAEVAVGEVLLFLHADSVLPPRFGAAVVAALQG